MPKIAFLLLTALVTAAPAAAQVAGTGYAPGTHRYRVTREARSSQEVMGTVQSGTVTTYEELTLDLATLSRDTMRFTFTIDSTSRQSDMPGEGEAPLPNKHRISGRIAPTGIFHGFDSAATSADETAPAFRSFLPRLPAGPLTVGSSWTDTVGTPFTQAGIQGTTRTIIASRVIGDTTIGGRKAWRIERTGTLSMSGTGHEGGADLRLSGGGTATGVSHVGVDGIYLGGTSNQALALTVEVPAANLTIPIKQTAITRVERIASPARP